jgi:hypothetical protein
MNTSPTRSQAQSASAVQASSGPLSQRSTAGVTAVRGQPVQLIDQNIGGDGAFNQPAQAFPSVYRTERVAFSTRGDLAKHVAGCIVHGGKTIGPTWRTG